MTDLELAQQDHEIALSAVAALAAAQRHAAQSGRGVVLVVNRKILRLTPTGSVGIKTLPPRKKVTVRVKRAHS